MALYARLLGRDDSGTAVANKIPVHQFVAILAEFARGQRTGTEANALIDRVSGAPLTAPEKTEATTLVGTITGTAAAKLARAKEIDDVLMIAEQLPAPYTGTEPYDLPAQVKTRLGV